MTVQGAIDCDVHCAPAGYDALLAYLDESWHEYIARAKVQFTGLAHAYPPGAPTTGTPVPGTYEELRERVLEPAAPSRVVLNCLSLFEVHRNPYYAAAVARAVNDWLRHEWLARDERLLAGLVVSPADPDAAVAEIDRVGGEPGFTHVLLPVRSDAPYGQKRFHPVYEAATRHGLAIALHAWGRAGSAPVVSGFTPTYLEDYTANALAAQPQVTSLVAEGVFARFPDLRVVLLECGFAWLPPLLWRLDKDWRSLWREIPWVAERPSEYVRRHVWSTIEPAGLPADPAALREQLDIIGVDRLLYATDHPHDHGPGGERLLAALDEAEREAVLRGNARAALGPAATRTG